jgi:hypothetical protein
MAGRRELSSRAGKRRAAPPASGRIDFCARYTCKKFDSVPREPAGYRAAPGAVHAAARWGHGDQAGRAAGELANDYHRIAGGWHGYDDSGFFTGRVVGRQAAFDRLLSFAEAALRKRSKPR